MTMTCPPHEGYLDGGPCSRCGASYMTRLLEAREEAEEQATHWEAEATRYDGMVRAERSRLAAVRERGADHDTV